jgi:spore coat polysaccharide biosynthesis protein SpsF (cytidylyltransferase family)
MNKSICLVINARTQSTRIPKKLVRDFGDTTLLDIALRRLLLMKEYPCFLAAIDEEIVDLYNKSDIMITK